MLHCIKNKIKNIYLINTKIPWFNVFLQLFYYSLTDLRHQLRNGLRRNSEKVSQSVNCIYWHSFWSVIASRRFAGRLSLKLVIFCDFSRILFSRKLVIFGHPVEISEEPFTVVFRHINETIFNSTLRKFVTQSFRQSLFFYFYPRLLNELGN